MTLKSPASLSPNLALQGGREDSSGELYTKFLAWRAAFGLMINVCGGRGRLSVPGALTGPRCPFQSQQQASLFFIVVRASRQSLAAHSVVPSWIDSAASVSSSL